ncbi:hypothetical protein CJP74_05410 [Psittacicella melopsittaci]|uniref:YqcC-like domain-containing protein n=1 Tax=Psittacicella melopsittaci TaxID=2028576 RepID=A0A3A1Y3R3_9GAMM|nr:YqcC family protein [Psittacicella melopsittaci]RIY32205.1 hypothetical protein CJP74_05410 [Psittacicella melopsittaci]
MSNLKQQITQHLEKTKDFLHQSPQFDTQNLTVEQRQYKEPFGIDQMKPEQWLSHIYIDYALLALASEQYDVFQSIDGFTYFFEYSWRNQSHPDYVEAISLIREYEQLIKTFIAQQNKK